MNLKATEIYTAACVIGSQEKVALTNCPCHLLILKTQGVMSARNVDGGLVFYFLEMVSGKAVLFLETGQIKGYLEKLKIFIFQLVPLTTE